eukprot:g9366.t1
MMSSTVNQEALGAAVGKAGSEELFDWNKQWYPMLSLKDTDPSRAHAVQLLGKDLVVWRDKEERWTCFDDRCPHRAAPLTEGRVEDDGSLLCAYHAWRFDADGKCLSIPQSDSGGRDEAQPKACAKVYPTQVAQDMIWVWGENGPDAALESALTPAQLIPELDDKEGLASGKVSPANVGANDLAYGWDTFMENVVDPAHVPVSHHGIAGDRYTSALPLGIEIKAPVSKEGFKSEHYVEQTASTSRIAFRPPCLVVNETEDADGVLKLVLYGNPTRPGYCRIIGRQVFVHRYTPGSKEAKDHDKMQKSKGQKKSPVVAVSKIVAKMPSWLQHVSGHLFLHQDLVFLHHQEKILASAGYDSSTYGQAVYVPAPADRAVLALRQWIAKYGSGGPTWDKGCNPTLPPREHNREVLFNVWETHTKNCQSCLGALKNVKRALKATKTSAVVSFAWALLRGARALGTTAPSASVLNTVTARAVLPGVALMLASLGATKALEKLHGMFYSYSFHHQDSP